MSLDRSEQDSPIIGIWAAPRAVFREAAEALHDGLQSCGVAVRLLQDIPDGRSDVAACVIVGRGTDLDEQAVQRWARVGRNRPVLLWQLEALPHPQLPPHLERLGESVECPDWPFFWSGSASAVAGRRPLRGELQRVARRCLAFRYERQLARFLRHGPLRLDRNDVAFLHGQARWLRKHACPRTGWVRAVACSTESRLAYLRRCEIDAFLLPVPSSRMWGTMPKGPPDKQRDIDLLLLGRFRSRARHRLARRVKQFVRSRSGVVVEVVEGCHGAARTALLQRSRIVLQLPAVPWDCPAIRLLAAIQCGALVVSTPAAPSSRWVAGRHFVEASEADLVGVVGRWLDDEPARRAFAQRALAHLARTEEGPTATARRLIEQLIGWMPRPASLVA